MARISRHHHGLERALRSAPDLDHIVDSDEMIGLSRSTKTRRKALARNADVPVGISAPEL
jgi:hypothetical protein